MARGVRRHDHRAVQTPRRLVGLRAGALHARRGLRQGRVEGLRRSVQQGLDLPRQLHGQLGSGLRLGDQRPGGRGARSPRHALSHRLPAQRRQRRGRRCDGAPGDDAGRRRGRGASRRRALQGSCRQDGDAAAGRSRAADHRRRVRQDRLRHRLSEDHARPRPQRLRDRAPPRPARAQRDRRGRAHDRSRGAVRGAAGRRGAGGGCCRT